MLTFDLISVSSSCILKLFQQAAQAAAVAKEAMLVPPPLPEPASTPIEQNNNTTTENTEDVGVSGSAGDSTGNNTASYNPEYSTSGTSEAEVEDLRKR